MSSIYAVFEFKNRDPRYFALKGVFTTVENAWAAVTQFGGVRTNLDDLLEHFEDTNAWNSDLVGEYYYHIRGVHGGLNTWSMWK